jgi:hypothetical protein
VLLFAILTPVGATDKLATVTANELARLVPQLFPAVTEIFPFCPALPVVAWIDMVPFPDVIVHPPGTVHVYVVAFGTAVMLYAWFVNPGHCAAVPVIAPGVAGVAGRVA